MGEVSVLGVDLAKHIFQVCGLNSCGEIVLERRLRRWELARWMAQLSCCVVAMEACGGAHYWARLFRRLGHEVRLVSPQFVKPYVKTNKTDRADAAAIAEAATRPEMRFVPIKGVEHQDLQSLHRVRERLVKGRTALLNEIRGLLQEYGVVLPAGPGRLKAALPEVLCEANNEVTPLMRQLVQEMCEELTTTEKLLEKVTSQIEAIGAAHPVCQRLQGIPGVGPLTSTAMLAAVPEPHLFRNGRELAAWLGLVPRQHSSGGKPKLLGISKRGDGYVRRLLIHGARAVVSHKDHQPLGRRAWISRLIDRRGMNRATVALANKNARTVWALMAREGEYRAPQ